VEAVKPLLEELRQLVLSAKTQKEVEGKVAGWIDEHKGDPVLSGMIFGPALQAELAGQLMIDVHTTKRIELTRQPIGGQLFLFQADRPAFLNLPWTEAIELYKDLERAGKIPRNKEFNNQFSTLLSVYSERGADARELMLERLRARLLEQVNQALEQGDTFKTFADDLDEFTNGLGMGTENPSYLENVFRTNLMTSYGAGRQRALQETANELPLWQYRTVGDSRVRDSHRALENKIFAHGVKATDGLFPPNGFQCRCAAVAIDPDEMPEGFKPETAPPDGYTAEAGFSKSPTESITERIV
jgi:SPP1 gp7 family putative phage head morphogenesis protein